MLLPNADIDLERIRSEFPALASGFVYLDNAGGSMVLRRVAEGARDDLLRIRFAAFCAKRLIDSLCLERYGGVVRVSASHYNTPDEVDQLIGQLDEVIV